MSRVPFTYTWIEPGKVLIGSIPQLSEDYAALDQMGIREIVSLTRRDPLSYPGMSARDIHWYRAPIADNGIGEDDLMLNAAGHIKRAYDTNRPVYIHCRGGIGRSGTILIAYYVLHRGMTVDQARDMVRPRRNYEGNASAADQGSPQREWIDALEGRVNNA